MHFKAKIEWQPNLIQNNRSTRFIWVFIALGIYSCFKKYDMISVSHLLLYLYFVNSVTSRKHSSEGIICANFHWYYHDLIDSNWWNCSIVQYLFSMVPEFSLQNDFKKSFVWIEHLPTLICLLFKTAIIHCAWAYMWMCETSLTTKTWFWSLYFLQITFM